jgi:hypothetical protein
MMNHQQLKDFEEQARKQLNVEESGYFPIDDFEIPYFKGKDEGGRNVILAMYNETACAFAYTDEEEKYIGDAKVMAFSSIEHALRSHHVLTS